MTDTRRTAWDRLAHVARSFPGQRVVLAGRHPSPQILTTHAASMLLSGEPMPWTVANPVVPFFCISCRFSSCRRLSTIKRNKQAAGCPSAALLDTILAYTLCASRRPSPASQNTRTRQSSREKKIKTGPRPGPTTSRLSQTKPPVAAPLALASRVPLGLAPSIGPFGDGICSRNTWQIPGN